MKKKLFIAVFLLTNIFYTPNALSERERDSNRIDSFNTRNSLKTTISVGVGVPSMPHIRFNSMLDNNLGFGLSLGTLGFGTSGTVNLRYYFNDLNYYNSLYSETNFGFFIDSYSSLFLPAQKIGFEYRAEEGFTFNIAGGIGVYSSNVTTSVIPSFDILTGYSF